MKQHSWCSGLSWFCPCHSFYSIHSHGLGQGPATWMPSPVLPPAHTLFRLLGLLNDLHAMSIWMPLQTPQIWHGLSFPVNLFLLKVLCLSTWHQHAPSSSCQSLWVLSLLFPFPLTPPINFQIWAILSALSQACPSLPISTAPTLVYAINTHCLDHYNSLWCGFLALPCNPIHSSQRDLFKITNTIMALLYLKLFYCFPMLSRQLPKSLTWSTNRYLPL